MDFGKLLGHGGTDMNEMMETMAELEASSSRPKLICGEGVIEGETDWSKWVAVYPQYIDKSLKHSEGRKIGADDAIENPTAGEIAYACSSLGMRCVLEDKVHPRGALNRGRVKVELKRDGEFMSPGVESKKDLLRQISSYLQSVDREQIKRG